MKYLFFISLLMLGGLRAQAQQQAKPYAYIIKGGHVIDPKNNIDGIMDVAFTGGIRARAARPAAAAIPARGISPALPASPAREAAPAIPGRIALVAKHIDPNLADKVIDAKGLYVTPGLIDIHVHLFWGHSGDYLKDGPIAVQPDGFTFRSGVTTVVDAGSPGWRNFEQYKKQTIDPSQTRVLTLLNIVGTGMDGRGENNIDEMDPAKLAEMAKKYPEYIVGVKLAHFDGHTWVPTDRAMEAGRLADIPVMVDFGIATPNLSLDTLFNIKFRAGDIYTHAFFEGTGTLNPYGRESIVDANGKVKPYVYRARQKGVIFDVGFGSAGYRYSQGIPAVKSGFYPNTISTDLHTGSMNTAMKSMENLMGLFMASGMPLKEVIAASTWNPAQVIKRPQLGNLSEGSEADIAVFRINEGNFGWPVRGGKIPGKKRFQTEMTIRNGNVVYDLDGLSDPAGPSPASISARQR